MTAQSCIEIEDLWYAYPDGREALCGVSLSVRPGEKVALVGANGAGKSTLLLHLNGVLQGRGTVRVFGQDVAQPNLAAVRTRVGMVFEEPDDQLFCPTVFDDVAFGPLHMGLPESVIRQRVEMALERVGLEGYASRVPHHLSRGEKKRAAIATVFSMEPDILVLDEPTSGLDPRSRRRLLDLLASQLQTMVVATHDLDLVARLCPRAVVLDRGRVAADGRSDEILGDTELLWRHGLE
ncbi:MAG: ABC transporter ATP-binding protein [Anaerolineales bacterium]|nr:MAG: ABC transporter ATP-binding protein [Anaerolineales bacterium]